MSEVAQEWQTALSAWVIPAGRKQGVMWRGISPANAETVSQRNRINKGEASENLWELLYVQA